MLLKLKTLLFSEIILLPAIISTTKWLRIIKIYFAFFGLFLLLFTAPLTSSGGSIFKNSKTFLKGISCLGKNSTRGRVSKPMKFLRNGWPHDVQISPVELIKALVFMHLLQITEKPSLSENGLALTLRLARSISSYQATGIFRAWSFSYPNLAVLKASNL